MLTLRVFLREFESTLQNHDALNPALWDGEHLRPEVRAKLLAFGEAFREHCKVPAPLVQDVLMVGGSAGYNWTPQSDIDVHLLVDRTALGPPELVDAYLKLAKKNWSLEHHATVRGQPLEGYVQDPTESSPKSQGVYSLKRDAWLRKPEKSTHSWTTDQAFAAKVENLEAVIDHLVETRASLSEFAMLKKRIADMRAAGLRAGGEYSQDNAVFKELRNRGALQRMTDYVRTTRDRDLSLEQATC